MTGSNVIYRYTNLGDDWANVGFTDKIEFDTGAVPDTTGHVVSTTGKITRSLQQNPKPRSNNADEIQDNGVSQISMTIAGYIENVPASVIEAQFITWMINDNTSTNFPFGRFGIHFFDRSAWNTAPVTGVSTGHGFLIEDVEISTVEGFPITRFIVKLRYNGLSSGIGSGV